MAATLQISRFTALTITLLSACGAPPPATAPAKTDTTPPPATSAPSPAPTESAAVVPSSAAPVASAATEPAPAASAAPLRTMSDILTAPTIAYMINYGESGPKEAADKLCTSRSGDDPGKRAECMDKERDKFMADVLVFSKAAKVVSFTIYRRARNTLAELSKSRVEFDKDSANGVIVKVLSDKGTRVLFPGKKEFTVSAPTDSSIEIDDPQSGKLIYEARIGLVDKPAE